MTYTITREELERTLTTGMNAVLNYAVDQGFMQDADADKITDTCSVVIVPRQSLLEKFASMLFGAPPTVDRWDVQIEVVKLIKEKKL